MTMQSLIPWRRTETEDRPFLGLQTAFNQMLEDFERDMTLPRTTTAWGVMPTLDLSEDNEAYRIAVDVPGVKHENIEISMKDNVLTIKGEKREEKEEKKRDYYRHERSFGNFCRTLTIPGEVDVNKVSATCKDGVLNVYLPKSHDTGSAAKKITVKGS